MDRSSSAPAILACPPDPRTRPKCSVLCRLPIFSRPTAPSWALCPCVPAEHHRFLDDARLVHSALLRSPSDAHVARDFRTAHANLLRNRCAPPHKDSSSFSSSSDLKSMPRASHLCPPVLGPHLLGPPVLGPPVLTFATGTSHHRCRRGPGARPELWKLSAPRGGRSAARQLARQSRRGGRRRRGRRRWRGYWRLRNGRRGRGRRRRPQGRGAIPAFHLVAPLGLAGSFLTPTGTLYWARMASPCTSQ